MRDLINIVEGATPPPEMVKYMSGLCIDFALALLTTMPRATLVGLGEASNGWDHVGVKLGDDYYDARGKLTADQFTNGFEKTNIDPVSLESAEALVGLQAVPFPYRDNEDIEEALEAVAKVFP